MIEIEFRGRSTHNGEWHYGWLTYSKFHNAYEITDGNGVYNFVDPKTVGPYTGKKDKFGKKIFGGDIVLIENKYVRYIVYSGVRNAFITMMFIDELESAEMVRLGEYEEYDIEVIGNIHDNPELLNKILKD